MLMSTESSTRRSAKSFTIPFACKSSIKNTPLFLRRKSAYTYSCLERGASAELAQAHFRQDDKTCQKACRLRHRPLSRRVQAQRQSLPNYLYNTLLQYRPFQVWHYHISIRGLCQAFRLTKPDARQKMFRQYGVTGKQASTTASVRSNALLSRSFTGLPRALQGVAVYNFIAQAHFRSNNATIGAPRSFIG